MFPSLRKQIKEWDKLLSNSTEEQQFDIVSWINSAGRLIKIHGKEREKKVQILDQIIKFYKQKLNDDQQMLVFVYLLGKSIDRL